MADVTAIIVDFFLGFPYGFWALLATGLLMTRWLFSPSRMLIYSGLGAATTAFLTLYGYIELPNFFLQFVGFAVATSLWAVLFLYPFLIKDYFMRRYRHLVGGYCRITGRALVKGKDGMAVIDDKTFKARMQSDSGVDTIPPGEQAKIINTRGATLIVTPTSVPMPSREELASYRDHLKRNPLVQEW